MGKIRLSDFVDDYDEYDELYGGKQKITKKNDKNKNNYEENLQQSQRMPAGWREGDSHIGKQKKQEITVTDPFGTEWILPSDYVYLDS